MDYLDPTLAVYDSMCKNLNLQTPLGKQEPCHTDPTRQTYGQTTKRAVSYRSIPPGKHYLDRAEN